MAAHRPLALSRERLACPGAAKPARRLGISRERLGDLDPEALAAVVGGTHVRTDCGCVTHGYSCDYCAMPTTPIASCSMYCPTTTLSVGLC